jgi:hypothetical protein
LLSNFIADVIWGCQTSGLLSGHGL